MSNQNRRWWYKLSEENVIFNTDDIYELVLAIDPSYIQNEQSDILCLTAETIINYHETVTPADVEIVHTNNPSPPPVNTINHPKTPKWAQWEWWQK